MSNLLFGDILLIFPFSLDIFYKCRCAQHVWRHIQAISQDNAFTENNDTWQKSLFIFSDIFPGDSANPSSEAAMPTECTPRLELNLSNVSKSIFFLLIKWNPILLEQPVLKEPIF